MRHAVLLPVFLGIPIAASCAGKPKAPPASTAQSEATASPTFRVPFTLTLHVDEEHYYEEEFGPIPYTDDGNVYLFKGDHFGVDLDESGSPTYQPDLDAADLEFEFSQEVDTDPTAPMLLVISNHTEVVVSMDALMTVPGGTEILETTILDVHPGSRGYESWAHPIVQLVLHNIRVER